MCFITTLQKQLTFNSSQNSKIVCNRLRKVNVDFKILAHG